jgi:hypothetical protein
MTGKEEWIDEIGEGVKRVNDEIVIKEASNNV